jgi:NAD(P)-dependent dehydrogenase (short-subunit alcohol dehydrogenase family)
MIINDKVVVVTGGGSGIGEALCRRFALEGARAVIVADVNEFTAKAVADEIKGVSIKCDVSREEDVQNLVLFTEEKYGTIDLFCSNAGIAIAGGVECPNEKWQRIWEINVLSHVFVGRAIIPGMIKRGTSSAAGLLSQIGSLPYSTTKHAAVGLAESIAITYGDQGIKVFALCPQAVRTAMAGPDGGVAAVDGLMEPQQLAEAVIDGLQKEEFLILPHQEVKKYMQRKTENYDRWLQGMRKLQARFYAGNLHQP